MVVDAPYTQILDLSVTDESCKYEGMSGAINALSAIQHLLAFRLPNVSILSALMGHNKDICSIQKEVESQLCFSFLKTFLSTEM